MKEKFMRFMQGRYGMDQLSRFLLGVGFVLVIVSLFVRKESLSLLIFAILLLVYFRMFSRNISRRYMENRRFLDMTLGIRRRIGREKGRIEQRRVYRFYKCPACSQQVRVPKGKGKIEIDCPRCHTKFIKRS